MASSHLGLSEEALTLRRLLGSRVSNLTLVMNIWTFLTKSSRGYPSSPSGVSSLVNNRVRNVCRDSVSALVSASIALRNRTFDLVEDLIG